MQKLSQKSSKEVNKEGLANEAEKLLFSLAPQSSATVVGLYGELGAGKTSFVQALAKILGVSQNATSPTFVIEKIYKLDNSKLNNGRFNRLIHIDAYRLKDSRELKALGWDTIISDPKNLIVIEWADTVEDILPKDTKKIYLSILHHNMRVISYA